jgi:hypothetical protein
MDRERLQKAATPRAIRAAIKAGGDELAAGEHHHGGTTSTRTANYKGHEIVIVTSYQISVDGQPFEAALTVDNSGRVHYHGLPTRDFASAVSLVKKAIDQFPDDFPDDGGGGDGGHGGDHGGDHGGGH